jgi:hypothetical protein
MVTEIVTYVNVNVTRENDFLPHHQSCQRAKVRYGAQSRLKADIRQ